MNNIVICTDGTWNRPDQTDRDRQVPSNVVKLARALAGQTAQGVRQLVYYDPGVGTLGPWDKLWGGVTGAGLALNVRQAYAALGRHYTPGDRVYLFGFSRGAFTARSLGGLVGLCGIPDPDRGDLDQIVAEAFRIYRRDTPDRAERGLEHARRWSHIADGEVANEVWFIGVWDTVGALGVPVGWFRRRTARPHEFHDVTLGEHVRHAYHALAIDERREQFEPGLWAGPGAEGHVEQVWFPGVHANIGGGYVDAGLSDRALLWMCAKALEAGLAFDADYMARRVDPNGYGEIRVSRTLMYKGIGARLIRKMGSGLNERIHWTAQRRYEFATEDAYRRSAWNLGESLRAGSPPVLDRLPAERVGFQGWNGGRGYARRIA